MAVEMTRKMYIWKIEKGRIKEIKVEGIDETFVIKEDIEFTTGVTIPEDAKYCSSCRKVKWKTEFHKKQKSKDGLQYICKSCQAKMVEGKNKNKIDIDEEVKYKKCIICKEVKPVLEFYKDYSRKDGLCNKCKDCDHKMQRERWAKNKKLKEPKKKNKTTKICTMCKKEKKMKHFSKDKYSKDGKFHRCRDCNREYMREYNRKMVAKNKEKNQHEKNQKYILARIDNIDIIRPIVKEFEKFIGQKWHDRIKLMEIFQKSNASIAKKRKYIGAYSQYMTGILGYKLEIDKSQFNPIRVRFIKQEKKETKIINHKRIPTREITIEGEAEATPNKEKCKRCGKEKPVENFAKNSTKPTGRSSWCKECHREYEKERRKQKEQKQKKGKKRNIFDKFRM